MDEKQCRQIHPIWIMRVIYIAWLGVGIVITGTSHFTPYEPSIALSRLPDILQTVLGLFMATGAVTALVGVRRWTIISKGWQYERYGLLILAVTWLSYFVAAAFFNPGAFVTWSHGLTNAAICASRFLVVHCHAKLTRQMSGASHE